MNTMHSLYEFQDRAGRKKCIKTICGDICDITDQVDILICSAYKNEYSPVPGTLIGALWNRKGIAVHQLAKEPEMDLRVLGGWISKELPGNFKRIACIELIDWADRMNLDYQRSVTLTTAFTTMRFLLEQSANRGVTIRRAVLPLLGAGSQNIEPCYIAVPLIKECIAALESIGELQEIVFCDVSAERIEQLQQAIRKLTSTKTLSSPIFISYSTLDTPHAQLVRSLLRSREMDCWMAPESIPTGSSYIEEITTALSGASAVALILSPNAEISHWVPKEVGVAISRGCPVYPFQIKDYSVNPTFNFLLEGCQIYRDWNTENDLRYQQYVDGLVNQLHARGQGR